MIQNPTRRELCLSPVRKSVPHRPLSLQRQNHRPPYYQQVFHQYLRTLAQSAVRIVIETVMREELDQFIGAAWGECSPECKGYRNGHYTRDLVTSTGRLEEIKVPRDREGHFHTQAFDDITLIQLIVERGVDALKDLPEGISNSKDAMAETIENNLRRVIIEEMPINPNYYEKMSELLDTLIQERQNRARDYEQYLARIIELAGQVQNPTSGIAYPKLLNTRAKRALYDNLGKDEQLAIAVDAAIRRIKKDGWRGNKIKEREVRYAIRDILKDETQANKILEIVKHQDEY